MQATARIETIAQQCLSNRYPYPEPLVTAICQYVSGEGVLAPVQHEWQQASSTPGSNVRYFPDLFMVLSDPAAERLDEMDLRVLDICLAISTLNRFLIKIALAGPVQQVYAYLLSHGLDKYRLLKELLETAAFIDSDGQPTALGKVLLSLLPEQAQDMVRILAQGSWTHISHAFIQLLLAARPAGYLDLAEQVALAAQQQSNRSYQLGQCAELLVKHNYPRFKDWARHIAGPTSPGDERSRATALEALLECNLSENIDLAIDAAQTPPGTYRWSYCELQKIGLDAAYRYDPAQYLPLVEAAALAPNSYLGKHAVELLKEADFAQARPILQRCVASGDTDAALKALDVLLKHDWPERQTYMLSLLAHRSKQLRDALVKGLMQESVFKDKEELVEALVPYLAHASADARLTTVQALRLIAPQQAPVLLAPRLDAEKSLKVKQAILDVVGVASLADASQPSSASPKDALIAEAEATLKRVARPPLPRFDPARMPALRWQDGESFQPAVLSYLLFLQSRVKTAALDTRIKQALLFLERSNQGELALTLFNGWIGQGARSEQSWCLPLICALADERLIHPLRQYLDGWVKTGRGSLAAKAVGAMALIESDLALAEINDLAERAKHSQVKAAARQAITDAAEHRNMSLEELADLIVPALGFDEKGERIFDYGPRQFTARLLLDQTLQITDNAGKRVTSLPKPGARDDENKAKAAQVAWGLLKKQVPQVVKMQTQRLENALITQRAWSVARWQALFLKHPVLRSLAITLVWGVITPGQPHYQTLFRPLEDASLTDPEDNAVMLPTEGTIRMVHPVELDEATISAWLQHLADYEITPPFPQLNRPIVRVSPAESEALWWEKYQGYVMNGGALKGRYLKAGWERGSVQDGGVYSTLWKEFPAAGVQAVLETAGMSIGYEQAYNTAIERLAFARTDTIKRGSYVYDDLKEQDERIIKLGDVPPIIFSEIAADLQTFAAAGEYAEDWKRKVWS